MGGTMCKKSFSSKPLLLFLNSDSRKALIANAAKVQYDSVRPLNTQ